MTLRIMTSYPPTPPTAHTASPLPPPPPASPRIAAATPIHRKPLRGRAGLRAPPPATAPPPGSYLPSAPTRALPDTPASSAARWQLAAAAPLDRPAPALPRAPAPIASSPRTPPRHPRH